MDRTRVDYEDDEEHVEGAKNVGEEPDEGGKEGHIRGEREEGHGRDVANSLNYLFIRLRGTSLALHASWSVTSTGFHDRQCWI